MREDKPIISPEFFLTEQAAKGMWKNIDDRIASCYDKLLERKKQIDQKFNPGITEDAIKKEFKESVDEIIYKLLKDAGLLDIDKYMIVHNKMQKDGKGLPEGMEKIDAALLAFEEKINKAFQDIKKVTQLETKTIDKKLFRAEQAMREEAISDRAIFSFVGAAVVAFLTGLATFTLEVIHSIMTNGLTSG